MNVNMMPTKTNVPPMSDISQSVGDIVAITPFVFSTINMPKTRHIKDIVPSTKRMKVILLNFISFYIDS